MSKEARKPDLEKSLSVLKDFQRRTVDYVFRRLYLDGDDCVKRFLVADEVGLGKDHGRPRRGGASTVSAGPAAAWRGRP